MRNHFKLPNSHIQNKYDKNRLSQNLKNGIIYILHSYDILLIDRKKFQFHSEKKFPLSFSKITTTQKHNKTNYARTEAILKRRQHRNNTRSHANSKIPNKKKNNHRDLCAPRSDRIIGTLRTLSAALCACNNIAFIYKMAILSRRRLILAKIYGWWTWRKLLRPTHAASRVNDN